MDYLREGAIVLDENLPKEGAFITLHGEDELNFMICSSVTDDIIYNMNDHSIFDVRLGSVPENRYVDFIACNLNDEIIIDSSIRAQTLRDIGAHLNYGARINIVIINTTLKQVVKSRSYTLPEYFIDEFNIIMGKNYSNPISINEFNYNVDLVYKKYQSSREIYNNL